MFDPVNKILGRRLLRDRYSYNKDEPVTEIAGYNKKEIKYEQEKRWRKTHPEKVHDRRMRQYYANLEREREIRRKRYQANREQEIEKSKKWRQAHPEHIREYVKRYYQNKKKRDLWRMFDV